MNLPHEPVGWFLFLLWIAVTALLVVPLFFALQTLWRWLLSRLQTARRWSLGRLQAVWQWLSSREERREESELSHLRNALGVMLKEYPDEGNRSQTGSEMEIGHTSAAQDPTKHCCNPGSVRKDGQEEAPPGSS
jgi:hypothetical protein